MRKFKVGDRIQITTTTNFYKSGETGLVSSLVGMDEGEDSQYEVRLDLPCYNPASGGRWYVLESEIRLNPPQNLNHQNISMI